MDDPAPRNVAQAVLARPPVSEEGRRQAQQSKVVEREHHRDTGLAGRSDHRRREHGEQVVDVHHVRPEPADGPPQLSGGGRRPLAPGSETDRCERDVAGRRRRPRGDPVPALPEQCDLRFDHPVLPRGRTGEIGGMEHQDPQRPGGRLDHQPEGATAARPLGESSGASASAGAGVAPRYGRSARTSILTPPSARPNARPQAYPVVPSSSAIDRPRLNVPTAPTRRAMKKALPRDWTRRSIPKARPPMVMSCPTPSGHTRPVKRWNEPPSTSVRIRPPVSPMARRYANP